jgi:hypothetical protein
MSMKWRFLGVGLTLSAPVAAQDVQGVERQEAARAELIAQAEGASDGGDHARALDLATRALTIRATPSLRLLIATEHNALGHVVEAYESAARCTREAQADPTARNRAQVIDACTGLSRSLDGRIGRVTVDVAAPPPGLTLRVAGGVLSQALWGVPYAVAPGAVVVEASAEGYAPFRQEATVAAGQTLPVRVALRPLDRPVAAPASPPTAALAPPPTVPPTPSAPLPVGPIALGAAGVASFVLAGVFFGLREGTVADRDAQCSAAGCQPSSLDLDATARTQTTLVNVFLGVGAAAVVGAGVWYFVGRATGGRAPPRVSLRGAFAPVQGGALIGLGGSL